MRTVERLSTPHGALGTWNYTITTMWTIMSFNSTRCIRNMRRVITFCMWEKLSTPHGALGTQQTQAVGGAYYPDDLSTPHGALGTFGKCGIIINQNSSFNSTRCIRNDGWEITLHGELTLSTPHGALGTAIPLICEGIHEELSTPHGALGTSHRRPALR